MGLFKCSSSTEISKLFWFAQIDPFFEMQRTSDDSQIIWKIFGFFLLTQIFFNLKLAVG